MSLLPSSHKIPPECQPTKKQSITRGHLSTNYLRQSIRLWPANSHPTAIGSTESSPVNPAVGWSNGVGQCWHGPGVPFQHKGRDGVHPMGVQTLTASIHSCWQLDSEHCGLVIPEEKAFGQGRMQLGLPGTAHQHQPGSWWAARDHCCRHTQHTAGATSALGHLWMWRKSKTKKSQARSCSQKFKLLHQAHPLSAGGDSVMNRER